jgi:hypothetical protein
VLAYTVASALAGFPLASIVISATITTLAVGALILMARRRRRDQRSEATVEDAAGAAP